jgi:ABC-type branched-subunit amino acid transport system substrate-binding protein
MDFTPFVTRFKEADCDIVYIAGWISETWFFAKQRWDMGYKDMKVGHSGPFVDVNMYKTIVGADAAQGMIGQYWANWEFKKAKVNPKYIAMCQEAMRMTAEKQGKPFVYTGWIGWFPSHLLILAQAMQKAGTVNDADAIMQAIRGGTFDTTTGKWTMSGAKTYGSPIVFGCPSALCTIQGDKEVYLSEHPMEPIP